MTTDLRTLCVSVYFARNPRIRSSDTKRQYGFALKNFESFLGRAATLDDLNDDNIGGMMVYLEREGLSVRTINERRGRIHTLWSWLSRRGYVATWPTTPKIPEPERVPIAYGPEQIAHLFKSFELLDRRIEGIDESAWWFSLHMTEWDTAERITALVSCEWEHLDNGWLIIPAELRKAKKKDKAYELHADTIAALEAIREPQRKRIWPWPYCKSYLWIRYKNIRQKFGLPTDSRSSFHRLRKTVATHFEAAGGNATEFLGHSSRSVTMKYLDPRFLQKPGPSRMIFRPQSGATNRPASA